MSDSPLSLDLSSPLPALIELDKFSSPEHECLMSEILEVVLEYAEDYALAIPLVRLNRPFAGRTKKLGLRVSFMGVERDARLIDLLKRDSRFHVRKNLRNAWHVGPASFKDEMFTDPAGYQIIMGLDIDKLKQRGK